MKTLVIKWHSEARSISCNGDLVYLAKGDTPCVALDNGVVLILEGWKWKFMAGEDKVTHHPAQAPGSIVITGEFNGYAVGSMMEVKDV